MNTRFLLLVLATIFFPLLSNGQGCVAIRGNSSCSGVFGNTLNLKKGEFNSLVGFRYFKSFRHFRGDHEETERVEAGTEVINKSYFLDFSLVYGISDRVFVYGIIPFVNNNRSSMYEHGGNPPNGLGERHETSSRGLGDIRIGAGYWLFDPAKKDFNYSISMGVKLPTGKSDYSDTFFNQGPNRDQNVMGVVDQSIQPGDGATAIALDIQGFHPIGHNFGISTNLYYLFNFQETNGTLTRNGSSEFSCPDQFGVRAGGFFNTMSGFNTYLGGRMEGVPATDLIGGSAGYRRPGYAVSVEPGIGFSKNKFSVFTSVPIALYRNRTQSYQDKERTKNTGNYTHGDAAFADYLVNVVFSYRFGGSEKVKMEDIFK